MATYRDWRDRRAKPRAEITLAAAPGLTVERETLQRQVDAAKAQAKAEGMLDEPDTSDLDERLADVERRIAESGTTFKFEAMGLPEWRDLTAAHPPTDEQRQQRFAYDHTAFGLQREAVKRSLEDPALSDTEFDEFLADLSDGEFDLLWQVAHGVNRGGGGSPEALTATESRRSSRRRST